MMELFTFFICIWLYFLARIVISKIYETICFLITVWRNRYLIYSYPAKLKTLESGYQVKLKALESEYGRKLRIAKEKNEVLTGILSNPPWGFSALLDLIMLYDKRQDEELTGVLLSKKNPAPKAADIVRKETQRRREAEYQCRQAQCLLGYYRNLFPSIEDDIEESFDPIELAPEREDEDIASRYLSKDEYRQLSSAERNQRALDRFWERNKSKRLIGKLYEQYIGYIYEQKGYQVEYFGITEGLSDLGRDLICNKGKSILLIQCKNWSQTKTIYEKHIFQFFGTMFQFAKTSPGKSVKGVFYTATSLSEVARSFAMEFKIELHEDFPLKRYPMIKCNVSRNGEGIYHLPFDLQYDNTKINPKDGDRYCMTVAEAESAGFRRAYRWHGTQ